MEAQVQGIDFANTRVSRRGSFASQSDSSMTSVNSSSCNSTLPNQVGDTSSPRCSGKSAVALLDPKRQKNAKMAKLLSTSSAAYWTEKSFKTRNAFLQAQQLMMKVQEAVHMTEGVVNKFLLDDKGLLILAGYGLPPCVHTDDAFRTVRAGMNIVASCKVYDLPIQINETETEE